MLGVLSREPNFVCGGDEPPMANFLFAIPDDGRCVVFGALLDEDNGTDETFLSGLAKSITRAALFPFVLLSTIGARVCAWLAC